MQKILIVSCKNLISGSFDGGKKRILDIAKFLSKKNKIDIVCLAKNDFKKIIKLKFFNNINTFEINFFNRIINVFVSIINLKPMQNGYFFSKEMLNFINTNENKYDAIIFHQTRSAQYMPKYYQGKKILEMTDLISLNYDQTIKEISIFNPLKYLYFLERNLVKYYEKEILDLFDKIILISKKEVEEAKKKFSNKKISLIQNSTNQEKKLFKFKKSNYKILFVGNIKYLPNKLACYDFCKNILPVINKKYPQIEFNIVGEINPLDKLYLSLKKNVRVHGPVKKLDSLIKNSICGISNLKTATGIQTKVFTYISFGLPCVASLKSCPENLVKGKEVLTYKNDKEILSKIYKLIENKKVSNTISNNSFKVLKNRFNFNKIYGNYLK